MRYQLTMTLPTPFLALLFLLLTLTSAYHGTMTLYTPSTSPTSICGPHSPNTAIIAISASILSPSHPNNPLCNSQTIIYNSATGQFLPATIVDVCRTCADGDIAVSEELFREVAPEVDVGSTVEGIKWGGALWNKIARQRGL